VTVPTRPTSVACSFLCTAIKCQFCKAVPHQVLISNIASLQLGHSHKVVLPSRCIGPVRIFKLITRGCDSHSNKRRACNIIPNVFTAIWHSFVFRLLPEIYLVVILSVRDGRGPLSFSLSFLLFFII
jgi:hypothetical protein